MFPPYLAMSYSNQMMLSRNVRKQHFTGLQMSLLEIKGMVEYPIQVANIICFTITHRASSKRLVKCFDGFFVWVVVVVVPQRVCPSKPAPLRKSKQLAGECHRSSGLLMLCCVLMCVSAEQRVIMCVRLWVPVLHCVQTSSTESSILFR